MVWEGLPVDRVEPSLECSQDPALLEEEHLQLALPHFGPHLVEHRKLFEAGLALLVRRLVVVGNARFMGSLSLEMDEPSGGEANMVNVVTLDCSLCKALSAVGGLA